MPMRKCGEKAELAVKNEVKDTWDQADQSNLYVEEIHKLGSENRKKMGSLFWEAELCKTGKP